MLAAFVSFALCLPYLSLLSSHPVNMTALIDLRIRVGHLVAAAGGNRFPVANPDLTG
jgi:hypothetical protein